ncbi:dihydroxyacetone kinase subunit DhaL [[Eubacterium] cellulosolvens]
MPEQTITISNLRHILKNISIVIKENEGYLTELDSQIGDADHGINMRRGFDEVQERISNLNLSNIESILQTTGIALIEKVGGAAGPLYGMFFIKASKKMKDKIEIDKKDLANLFKIGLSEVQSIGGGTVVGEKTMVDVISPVVNVLKKEAENGNASLISSLEKVVDAAKKGMENTIPLIAKKGRASYLGERSRGHQDPGATSSYLIIRTFLDTLSNKKGIKIITYDSDGSITDEKQIE